MSSWKVGDLLCKLQVTSSKGTVVLEHIKALHCPCLSTDCSLPNPSTRIAGCCLPLPRSVPAVPWLFQSLGVPKLCGIKEEPHVEQRAEAPCFVSKSSNSPLPLRGSAHQCDPANASGEAVWGGTPEMLCSPVSRGSLWIHSHRNLNPDFPGAWEQRAAPCARSRLDFTCCSQEMGLVQSHSVVLWRLRAELARRRAAVVALTAAGAPWEGFLVCSETLHAFSFWSRSISGVVCNCLRSGGRA